RHTVLLGIPAVLGRAPIRPHAVAAAGRRTGGLEYVSGFLSGKSAHWIQLCAPQRTLSDAADSGLGPHPRSGNRMLVPAGGTQCRMDSARRGLAGHGRFPVAASDAGLAIYRAFGESAHVAAL